MIKNSPERVEFQHAKYSTLSGLSLQCGFCPPVSPVVIKVSSFQDDQTTFRSGLIRNLKYLKGSSKLFGHKYLLYSGIKISLEL
jgi:hypothetical protein